MKTAFLVLLLVSLAAPVYAVVLEVPLPGLTGHYFRESRADTVHLPAPPSVIYGASLRVRGTTTFSSWSCDGSGGYGPPRPLGVQYECAFAGTEPGYWTFGGHFDTEGAFDLVQAFEGHASFSNPPLGPTWKFLLDGVADIGLSFAGEPAIFECNQVGPDESTTIDEVTLLIDGEFPTPASTTSWGRVKSIYR